jgi:hypothetical protein
MLTERQQVNREVAKFCGVAGLFVGGLTMAILGGVSGGTILFGVGLGICIVITVAGLIIRERNIAGM